MTKVENLKPGDWDKANRRRVASVRTSSISDSVRIDWTDNSTTFSRVGNTIEVVAA